MKPTELSPLLEEPDSSWAALLCERCSKAIDAKKLGPDQRDLQFLSEAVWSELIPIQVLAVRLCRRLAEMDQPWAQRILEGLYLDPEVESKI